LVFVGSIIRWGLSFSGVILFLFLGMDVPGFLFLFFLSSIAAAAGPRAASTLAVVVDLVATSLLAGDGDMVR
jgi:hypothetical protein